MGKDVQYECSPRRGRLRPLCARIDNCEWGGRIVPTMTTWQKYPRRRRQRRPRCSWRRRRRRRDRRLGSGSRTTTPTTTGSLPAPPPAIAPQPERRARDVAVRCPGGEGGKERECRLRRRREQRRRREEEGGDDGGGANDCGTEARRRAAADRRRPGESLLFSSLDAAVSLISWSIPIYGRARARERSSSLAFNSTLVPDDSRR